MNKQIKFQCTLPSQCFPGRAGWEFLPAGYSGSYYAYVSQIHSKYNTHGHGGRKLFSNAESAILDILPEMQSRGILEMAVRLPDKSWVSIRSDGKVKKAEQAFISYPESEFGKSGICYYCHEKIQNLPNNFVPGKGFFCDVCI